MVNGESAERTIAAWVFKVHPGGLHSIGKRRHVEVVTPHLDLAVFHFENTDTGADRPSVLPPLCDLPARQRRRPMGHDVEDFPVSFIPGLQEIANKLMQIFLARDWRYRHVVLGAAGGEIGHQLVSIEPRPGRHKLTNNLLILLRGYGRCVRPAIGLAKYGNCYYRHKVAIDGSFHVSSVTGYQTLKRKCTTSPSASSYSFPSKRQRPASFAPCSPP